MTGGLDGAGLMHVDVAGVRGHHSGVGRGDGVDDGLVGLGAADQEPHVGLGAGAGPADLLRGGGADVVGTVSGMLGGVGGGEAFQDGGMRAAAVVVFEGQHGRLLVD